MSISCSMLDKREKRLHRLYQRSVFELGPTSGTSDDGDGITRPSGLHWEEDGASAWRPRKSGNSDKRRT